MPAKAKAKAKPAPPPLETVGTYQPRTRRDKDVLFLLKVAAEGPSRYAMNGIHVENGEQGRAVFVATNGKALAMLTRGQDTIPGHLIRFIEPFQAFTADRASVKELYKGAKKGDARDLATATPLEGHFPPYLEAIPRDTARSHVKVIISDTAALQASLKACEAFRGKSFAPARFALTTQGGTIECKPLEGPGQDLTISSNAMRLDSLTAAPVGFNPTLFLAALETIRATGCGKVPPALEVDWPSDAKGPAIIRYTPPGPERDSIIVLLMPVLF